MTERLALNEAIPSFALGILALVTWFLSSNPVIDYFLAGICGIAAAVLIVRFLLKRRLGRFFQFAPWIALYFFFQWAGTIASNAAYDFAKAAQLDGRCSTAECIGQDRLPVVRVGAVDGFWVNRLGASVFVRFDHRDDSCRLMTDYFFGREHVVRWSCRERGVPKD